MHTIECNLQNSKHLGQKPVTILHHAHQCKNKMALYDQQNTCMYYVEVGLLF